MFLKRLNERMWQGKHSRHVHDASLNVIFCHAFEEDASIHFVNALAFGFEWASRSIYEAAATKNHAYIRCVVGRKMSYHETRVLLLS